MLPSEQLQASLDIHLLDATISIAGCTRVERGNGASPCSSRLTPACRMLLHAFTSLSFLHLRRCSTHSVDLHLMLRWRCPHFCASFWQPAHSVVVLCSGVANTCTCRLAIFATSCTGSVSSSFPLGSTCAMPCITMSLLRRHIGRSPRTVAAIICRCIQWRVRHAHESVPLLHGYREGAFGSSFLLLARMSACTPAVILSSTLTLEAVVQAGEESAATRISAYKEQLVLSRQL